MPSATPQKPSTSKTKVTPKAWEALTPSLSQWILDATAAMGFERMTPVQANTIPLFMGNKDVVVEAVTGSGKTLAFLIPLVEKLLRLEEPIPKHHIGAIIISPTRELATQIYSVLESLLAFHAPSASALRPPDDMEGDAGIEKEDGVLLSFPSSTRKAIPQLLLGGNTTPAQDLAHFLNHTPNILISTPGRLLELLSSPRVHCTQSSFEALVLDEADRLLDLGFKDDLQKILQRIPKQRRTGLFSASVSEALDQLIRVGLRNPVRIAVKVKGASGREDRRTPSSLQMAYAVTPPAHKLPFLAALLQSLKPAPQKAIVYLSTCAAVDYLSRLLPTLLPAPASGNGIAVIPLHGKHTPAVRAKNFTRFTASLAPTLLLTTDVAARGLDIPAVDLVVQLDPPSDPKAFLHRCGRAGRAGRKGLAVVCLTPGREEDYVALLAVRQTPVAPLADVLPPAQLPAVTDVHAAAAVQTLRAAVLADRTLHDKGQRAFVSWVQSYSKHAASSVFRVQDLKWAACADAWALLRLPRMPELRRSSWDGDPALGLQLDWDAYAYRDKEREKKRRDELAATKTTSGRRAEPPRGGRTRAPQKPQDKSWSERKALQKVKEARRERKDKLRERRRVDGLSAEQRAGEAELARMVEEVKVRKKEERESEFTGFD